MPTKYSYKTAVKGDPFNYLLKIMETGQAFELVMTSASAYVVINNKKISFGDSWTPQALGLLSKLKSHLKKRPTPPPLENRINYIGFRPPGEDITNAIFEDVASIDLKAAYHSAALKLGYITPELYDQFLKLDKVERLKVFGAVARHETRYKHIGSEVIEVTQDTSPLAPFFHRSAEYIGHTLDHLKNQLGEDFYFYWVDCLFFKNTPENVALVENTFRASGFNYHFEHTDFIIFEATPKVYRFQRATGGDIKTYEFPRTDTRRSERARYFRKLNKLDKHGKYSYEADSQEPANDRRGRPLQD